MMTRRQFIGSSAFALGGCIAVPAQIPFKRVGIIGHTGRGDYGHGLDVAFNGLPGVQVVAVADPDEQGRAAALKATNAGAAYADWRELLRMERPDIVCLASRWSEHRHEIGRAALVAGAHIFSEKPFTRTLAEGDDLIATAKAGELKIAVAHQIRLAPGILRLKEAIDGGLIGELVQIQSWGKQDARAGGEDMIVLGSHLFNLIQFFAGRPRFCSARVLQDGREIQRNSGRTVREQIGLVAGNEIFAEFAFDKGVNATFTSSARLKDTLGPWSIRLLGSKGIVHVLVEIDPSIYISRNSKWSPDGRTDSWVRWPEDPVQHLPAEKRGFGPANRRVVTDFLEAIRDNRPPVCSGEAANESLEMIMSVYESAITGGRVPFPMRRRTHPLTS